MPKRITEDHENFRGILAGKAKEDLKKIIQSGQLFAGRPTQTGKIAVTIPQMTEIHKRSKCPPCRISSGTKKPKKYRSIEEPWEPSW